MAAQSKVTKYNLQERTLALAGEGATTDAIADILTKELDGKDTISQSTVSRWLKAERKERSEQTRSIVHDHIKATVPKDLDALDEVLTFLMSHFRNVLPNPDDAEKTISQSHSIKERAEFGMRAVKIVETKLRFAGILEDPTTTDASPIDLDEYKTPEASNG